MMEACEGHVSGRGRSHALVTRFSSCHRTTLNHLAAEVLAASDEGLTSKRAECRASFMAGDPFLYRTR